jgi:MFS family permease
MKTNAKAGIALAFLSFLHNKKAMIITGAILIGIGAAGAISLGPMLIQDYATGNIDPTTGRPYPVFGIVSPLYAQIAFIVVAIVGLGLLVWYATSTRWAKPKP